MALLSDELLARRKKDEAGNQDAHSTLDALKFDRKLIKLYKALKLMEK